LVAPSAYCALRPGLLAAGPALTSHYIPHRSGATPGATIGAGGSSAGVDCAKNPTSRPLRRLVAAWWQGALQGRRPAEQERSGEAKRSGGPLRSPARPASGRRICRLLQRIARGGHGWPYTGSPRSSLRRGVASWRPGLSVTSVSDSRRASGGSTAGAVATAAQRICRRTSLGRVCEADWRGFPVDRC
jgi:hypothetical protein